MLPFVEFFCYVATRLKKEAIDQKGLYLGCVQHHSLIQYMTLLFCKGDTVWKLYLSYSFLSGSEWWKVAMEW